MFKRNLDSLFAQTYQNWHALYINDCSSDDTGRRVENYLAQHDHEGRVTLINNEERRGMMANHYFAVHTAQPDDIIVHLDGDDWFASNTVLEYLNEVYQDENVWMTYGSYLQSNGGRGICRPLDPEVMENKTFRQNSWITSHLRTFRAWLFHQIPLERFFHQDTWVPVCCDMTMMFPLLEMASKGHIRFIDKNLYIYNISNPLNGFRSKGALLDMIDKFVRAQEPMEALDEPVIPTRALPKQAAMIVYSFDRPLQLYACLESLEHNVANVTSKVVIYRASNDAFEQGYQEVHDIFPDVVFVRQSDQPKQDFKPLTLQAFCASSEEYILFGVDDIVVTGEVDISQCISELEKTKAYAFFLRLGKNISYTYASDRPAVLGAHANLGNGVISWRFSQAKSAWKYSNNLDMTLYRKKDIRPVLQRIAFTTPNTLESHLMLYAPQRKLGLCFEHSKLVNIPFNVVQHDFNNRALNTYSTDDFLTLFNDGLKLDIEPLQYIDNNSPHIEYEPTFVPRVVA